MFEVFFFVWFVFWVGLYRVLNCFEIVFRRFCRVVIGVLILVLKRFCPLFAFLATCLAHFGHIK